MGLILTRTNLPTVHLILEAEFILIDSKLTHAVTCSETFRMMSPLPEHLELDSEAPADTPLGFSASDFRSKEPAYPLRIGAGSFAEGIHDQRRPYSV